MALSCCQTPSWLLTITALTTCCLEQTGKERSPPTTNAFLETSYVEASFSHSDVYSLQIITDNTVDVHVLGTKHKIDNTTVSPIVYPEEKVISILLNFSKYVTSVPGLMTNPLSILLAVSQKPSGTSELYILHLGIADFMACALRLYINIMYAYHIHWNDFFCKSSFYSLAFFHIFSNWILVAWTVERLFATTFPLQYGIWCTVQRTKKLLAGCFVCCALIVIPSFTEIKSVVERFSRCEYNDVYHRVYLYISSFFYIYLPMVVVAISNSIIIYKIRQKFSLSTNKKAIERRIIEQNRITLNLMLVATVFLLLHLPQLIARIWQGIYSDPLKQLTRSRRAYYKFMLFTLLGYSISQFQNSINFVLYCRMGSKYRRTLFKLFSRFRYFLLCSLRIE